MTNETKASLDILMGKLIGLSRAVENNTPHTSTNNALLNSLYILRKSQNNLIDTTLIDEAISIIASEKHILVPDCSSCSMPCGRTNDYDMKNYYDCDDDVLEAKDKLINILKDIAEDYTSNNINISDSILQLMYKSLILIGYELNRDAYTSLLEEIKVLYA